MSKLFRIVPAVLVAGGLVFAGSATAQAAPVPIKGKCSVTERKASIADKLRCEKERTISGVVTEKERGSTFSFSAKKGG